MKYFAYALIPLFCLMAVLYLIIQSVYDNEAETEAQTRASTAAYEASNEFGYLIHPLIASNCYLASSNALRELLGAEGSKDAVLNDFSLLAQTHPVFQQVRLLDTLGMEVFRVDYDGNGVELISKEELQDKSHRDYFIQAKALEPAQVYITPIDLNEEYGHVETPYKAVFRIINPVDNQYGIRVGYLVLNVSVERLFDLLDVQINPTLKRIVMLNSSGEGVMRSHNKTVYCFSNSSMGSFATDDISFWNTLKKKVSGELMTDSGVYAWKEFDITQSNEVFPNVISFLKPSTANFKVLAFSPMEDDAILLFIYPVDKLLILGLILTFLTLALSYAWGRIQVNKRHGLISNLNDELIKSQANLNKEKHSLKKVVHELTLRNNQLTEFSSIISHNIRAPLTSLTLLIQFLNDNFRELSEDNRKEAFEKLEMSSDALNSLARDLWATVNILDSKDVKLEKVNLNAVLLSVTEQLQNEISESRAEIKTNFNDWLFLIFNEGYLQNILVNLISNSIKYRSADRGLVVELVTETFQGKKVLKVIDNGRGINMDWHSNSVFGMHRTFHGDIAGRGMGLFMVKMQVEALGGNVFVESEEEQGSTFTIMF